MWTWSRQWSVLTAVLILIGTLCQAWRALMDLRERHEDIEHYSQYRDAIDAVPSYRPLKKRRVGREHLANASDEQRKAIRRVELDLVGWVFVALGAAFGLVGSF